MTEEDSEEITGTVFDQPSEGELTGKGRASSPLSRPRKLSKEQRERAIKRIEALYHGLYGEKLER